MHHDEQTVTQHPTWSVDAVDGLLARPLLDLVFEAAAIHRRHHPPDTMQCSQLLSIKTGGCPEDCKYCSQSVHYETPIDVRLLMPVDEVLAAAREAKARGADRFCMGAAWRQVKNGRQFDRVLEMVRGVKAMGLETCVTLGMLDREQARCLREAGLDYYNHNLDTGRSHYDEIITTRSYDDRLETLAAVRDAGIKVCCGGILGLGESRRVRAELLAELANLEPAPESVPINALVPVAGTPLGDTPALDWSELVRAVAAARILMPESTVRLSAGRRELSEEAQALCFLAGANSIFVGEELLTTPNPEPESDAALLAKLGLTAVTRDTPEPGTAGGHRSPQGEWSAGRFRAARHAEPAAFSDSRRSRQAGTPAPTHSEAAGVPAGRGPERQERQPATPDRSQHLD